MTNEQSDDADAVFEEFAGPNNHHWHLASLANKELVREFWHEAFERGRALGQEEGREEVRRYAETQINGIQRSSPTDATDGALRAFYNVLHHLERGE